MDACVGASAKFAETHGIAWSDAVHAANVLEQLSSCLSESTPQAAVRAQECALTAATAQALAMQDCRARFAGHVGTALVVALMALSMSLSVYRLQGVPAAAVHEHYTFASLASVRILENYTRAGVGLQSVWRQSQSQTERETGGDEMYASKIRDLRSAMRDCVTAMNDTSPHLATIERGRMHSQSQSQNQSQSKSQSKRQNQSRGRSRSRSLNRVDAPKESSSLNSLR